MEEFFTQHFGISPDTFRWVVLPMLIFTSRVCDVSLSTMRQIFVVSGKRRLAPVLGVFESLLWLLAISTIMKNLDNFACYVGYASGFATGIFVGMTIEEKLALGKVMVRVITRREVPELIERLRESKFGFTFVEGEGKRENVKLIFSVVNRADLPELLDIICSYNPNAFYTVESVRYASQISDYVPNLIGGGGLFSIFGSSKRK
ncbi:MAG: DUF2179 domain-containing protein [Cytophagales bacterium]|jgi:uncharacterized protein YebE (UPF0316 family)|nr:DUF2179 domain-containing protein [Cytophagales bacterium]